MPRLNTRRRRSCSTISRRSSGCSSPTSACAPSPWRGRRHGAPAGRRSPAHRSRAAGQSGVRARLRAVSWWSRPSHQPAARGGALPRHRNPVPASDRCGRAHRFRVRPVSAGAGPQRPHLRNQVDRRQHPAPDELRSRPRAPDGFVGGPAARDDWNKLDVPGLRGISKTAPYFHNNSAATLEEMVDHYIQFFNRAKANNAACRRPLPRPTAGTSTASPRPRERAPLLAYLRKL